MLEPMGTIALGWYNAVSTSYAYQNKQSFLPIVCKVEEPER